jgi:hypothetical protein
LILQLRHWEVEHHHRPIGDPKLPPVNGVLLWFEVDDFDAAVTRATELRAEVLRQYFQIALLRVLKIDRHSLATLAEEGYASLIAELGNAAGCFHSF